MSTITEPTITQKDGIDGLRLSNGEFLPYVPPRICTPWCDYGDGHPTATSHADQTCFGEMRRVDLALYPAVDDGAGRYVPEEVTVYATDRRGRASFVQVSLADVETMRVLPGEARALAAHLIAVADEIESAEAER